MSSTSQASAFRQIVASPLLLTACACVVLGAIDLTVVAAILPRMIDNLGVNTADIDRYIWAVNIYLITYVIAIPVAGRASDVFGRRRVFLASLAVFALGTVVCATATSLTDLVIGRGIQGFGGGALLPIALALAGDTLSPRVRLAGIGIVSAAETVGWILGPAWGAVIARVMSFDVESWRWVFWFNLPILLLLAVLVWKSDGDGSRLAPDKMLRAIDLPGFFLLSISLGAINLALATGGELGVGTGTGMRALGGTENPLGDYAPWLLGVALLSTAALVLWERRTAFPVLPVTLYRIPAFLETVIVNMGIGAVLMVALVNVPVLVALAATRSDTGVQSAALLAPLTVSVTAGSLWSSRLTKRLGMYRATGLAMLLTVAGCLLIGWLTNTDGVWRISPGLVLLGAGIGIVMPPLSTIPILLAEASERGSAASSALMFRLLGMTIGISTLTALGVNRLQTLTSRVEPIVRKQDESTASFLLRQQQFILDHAVPLAVQVIQETFYAAAAIGLLTALPLMHVARRAGQDEIA